MLADLLDLVLPRPCPGCGGPAQWCRTCAATLAGRPRRVVLPPGPPAAPPVYTLARYRGPVRNAVIAGKERGRRDLPPLLGLALAGGVQRLTRLGLLTPTVHLVPAPSRRSAARQRGGDPVLRMAVAAAAALTAGGLSADVRACLETARGARDSVGLDARSRWQNLAGRVRWIEAAAPPVAAAVVLIDDVVTTGATTVCATAVLAEHGHDVALALTLASVPPLLR